MPGIAFVLRSIPRCPTPPVSAHCTRALYLQAAPRAAAASGKLSRRGTQTPAPDRHTGTTHYAKPSTFPISSPLALSSGHVTGACATMLRCQCCGRKRQSRGLVALNIKSESDIELQRAEDSATSLGGRRATRRSALPLRASARERAFADFRALPYCAG